MNIKLMMLLEIEDKDEFRTYLKEARDAYDTFKVSTDSVIDLLDIDTEKLRVDEIETLLSECLSSPQLLKRMKKK